MNKFKRSLEAEILKAKNSLALWLSFLGTSGIILAFFFILLFGREIFQPSPAQNPWHSFFILYYEGTAFMLLPLFVIITATLICFVEYRNDMWKHLLTSTVSRTNLYLSKLLFTYLLIVLAHIYFILMLLLSGITLSAFRPELNLLQYAPDISLLCKLAYKTLLSIGGMLALQFWISMRFRSFIVALGVGVIGFVLSSLLMDHWMYSIYIPYAHPLMYLQEIYLTKWISSVEIYSLLYFLIFGSLGLADFQKMKLLR